MSFEKKIKNTIQFSNVQSTKTNALLRVFSVERGREHFSDLYAYEDGSKANRIFLLAAIYVGLEKIYCSFFKALPFCLPHVFECISLH